jgi:hypothetical protein
MKKTIFEEVRFRDADLVQSMNPSEELSIPAISASINITPTEQLYSPVPDLSASMNPTEDLAITGP